MEPRAGVGPVSQVLLLLAVDGTSTRSALARHLGLSAATLTRAVRPLLETGLVIEEAPTLAGPGRPIRALRLAPRAAALLGVKLTADHLYAELIDPTGSVLMDTSEPLVGRDVDGVVAQIAALTARVAHSSDTPLSGMGLSLGASVVGEREIRVAPFLGWTRVPIAGLMAEATGLPVRVANDVRAFTYAEAWFGLGRGADPFALLTLGTGIGCGLAIGGRVIAGSHGAAGSVGHLPLSDSGPSCEIGHIGCARALASAPGIAAQASEVLGHRVRAEDVVGPQGLTDLARDPRLDHILALAAAAAGRIAGGIAALVDPELIVVSGEGVGVVDAHREAFDAAVERARHWSAPAPRILTRAFTFGEWARGAAALAVEPWACSVESRLKSS